MEPITLEGSNKHPRAVPCQVVKRNQLKHTLSITLKGLFCPECGSLLEVFGSEKLNQYRCVENGHYVLGEEALTEKWQVLRRD